MSNQKRLFVYPVQNYFINYRIAAVRQQKVDYIGNFFRLNGGCIIQALNMHFKLNIEEEKEAVLTRFMQEIYQILQKEEQRRAVEILVPFLPDNLSFGKNIHVPLKGDKLNLLELCTKNAKAFMFQQMKQEEIKDPEEGKNRALMALKDALHMERLPMHIECFDNSNTQGTNPVAACVVFRNGKPSKRDYRHFNIKTVVGANDYASMYEVVHRRYSRIIEEGGEMPQLILIDGGRGQLHFAYDALSSLGLLSDRPGNAPHPNFQKYGHIEVISIAERLEEIMIPDDPTPLFLDKNSPALKLLMHLRDEAHRFGITHHRKKRTKNQITSTLTAIKGVGEATQQKLLQHFKSVKRLKAASLEEIEAVVGKSMAQKIKRDL